MYFCEQNKYRQEKLRMIKLFSPLFLLLLSDTICYKEPPVIISQIFYTLRNQQLTLVETAIAK